MAVETFGNDTLERKRAEMERWEKIHELGIDPHGRNSFKKFIIKFQDSNGDVMVCTNCTVTKVQSDGHIEVIFGVNGISTHCITTPLNLEKKGNSGPQVVATV